jgi:peptidoglycan/LPS O-acetylase OafA/YrhL
MWLTYTGDSIMVANPLALLIGAIVGLFAAGMVGAWEDKMLKRNQGWIVTLSVLGALTVICVGALIIGSGSLNDISGFFVQVVLAGLTIFVVLRRVKILRNIFSGLFSGNKTDDEKK